MQDNEYLRKVREARNQAALTRGETRKSWLRLAYGWLSLIVRHKEALEVRHEPMGPAQYE
jgi:hypothetical protein